MPALRFRGPAPGRRRHARPRREGCGHQQVQAEALATLAVAAVEVFGTEGLPSRAENPAIPLKRSPTPIAATPQSFAGQPRKLTGECLRSPNSVTAIEVLNRARTRRPSHAFISQEKSKAVAASRSSPTPEPLPTTKPDEQPAVRRTCFFWVPVADPDDEQSAADTDDEQPAASPIPASTPSAPQPMTLEQLVQASQGDAVKSLVETGDDEPSTSQPMTLEQLVHASLGDAVKSLVETGEIAIDESATGSSDIHRPLPSDPRPKPAVPTVQPAMQPEQPPKHPVHLAPQPAATELPPAPAADPQRRRQRPADRKPTAEAESTVTKRRPRVRRDLQLPDDHSSNQADS